MRAAWTGSPHLVAKAVAGPAIETAYEKAHAAMERLGIPNVATWSELSPTLRRRRLRSKGLAKNGKTS